MSLAAAASATLLSVLSASNAGFASLFQLSPPAYSLLLSQFTGNPFALDTVSGLYTAASALNASSPPRLALLATIDWPNDHTLAPAGALAGYGPAVLVGGGFLVPPKTVGGVWALPLNASGELGAAVKLSRDKTHIISGWFYHRALLHDVDGDGRLDVLAARALKPLIGASAGELVWMQQPAAPADPLAPAALPWLEATLYNGSFAPDVFTAIANLRGDADEQLVYASFFTGGGLGMLICAGCAAGGAHWATAPLAQVTLDASIGPSFDVEVVDLNGDGALDLLVTNHVDNVSLSGVYAYEAPPAPMPLSNLSAWRRHVLASGFVVREPGPNQAAPGAARAMAGCAAARSSAAGAAAAAAAATKPLITVSGDGDQRYYILSPNSADPADWSYTQTMIYDCKGTAGRQAAADVDGDGCPELFLPCYDSSSIAVMRLDR